LEIDSYVGCERGWAEVGNWNWIEIWRSTLM